ncbi:MAG TPA: EAL domain-containing protein [Gaiellaceae bacterium]|nr:EAL domain-containing protein [Gaiellaceae bacterium]
MPYPNTVLYATSLTQAGGALLTAAVLHGLSRYHVSTDYLRHWTRSWLALAIYLLYGAEGAQLADVYGAAHPAAVTFAAVASAAGYLQIAWLLLGAYELTTGATVARPLGLRLFTALALLGAVTAVLFVWDPAAGGQRFVLRVGIRSATVGTSFLAAAYGIWHSHGRTRAFGPRLVSAAFVAYAVEQLHLFALGAITLATGISLPWADYVGLVDFLIQFAVGLGLVIWLLEAERQAAATATAQVEHLAYHDVLTGLPNRQLFLDRLRLAIAHAQRAGHKLAVFYFDLDRFKTINDSLGHRAGDRLLQIVADRLRHLLRAEDTVARLGGDEFTLLSPIVEHVEDAVTVARRVREAVKVPLTLEGRELFVTTSLGISIYPDDGDDAELLLKHADVALYRAKAAGRDTFELYTASMNAQALEQLVLESSLRRAVENGEFVMHYQPIVSLRSGDVTGLEALLRWRHPELGLLGPDSFIFLAEVTGLIVPIGEWALRDACTQLRRWQVGGHPELRAAVNLSVRQLQQPDFVSRVSRAIDDAGIAPRSLELEITESIAMHTADGTLETLRDLKRLGVRISVDDFGTGYSSLSALRLFPVDALKIDRSFVRDVLLPPHETTARDALGEDGGPRPAPAVDNTAIASAVIALAHSLRLDVVAEGVETELQLDFLRERKCDSWQGFLCSRPLPAEEMGRVLG